jgi:hypothetical protein
MVLGWSEPRRSEVAVKENVGASANFTNTNTQEHTKIHPPPLHRTSEPIEPAPTLQSRQIPICVLGGHANQGCLQMEGHNITIRKKWCARDKETFEIEFVHLLSPPGITSPSNPFSSSSFLTVNASTLGNVFRIRTCSRNAPCNASTPIRSGRVSVCDDMVGVCECNIYLCSTRSSDPSIHGADSDVIHERSVNDLAIPSDTISSKNQKKWLPFHRMSQWQCWLYQASFPAFSRLLQQTR